MPARIPAAGRLREEGVAIEFPEFVRRWETKLVEVYLGRREYWGALAELLGEEE